jgi:hypothetical protein
MAGTEKKRPLKNSAIVIVVIHSKNWSMASAAERLGRTHKRWNLQVRTRHWSKIKPKIRPLDLLLFRAESIQSRAILLAQTVKVGHVVPLFSHAALVVTKEVLPHIPQLKPNTLYVWECTVGTSDECKQYGAVDIEFPETGTNGVQIRELDKVLEYCNAIHETASWCPLINNPWLNRSQRKHIIQQFSEFHRSYGNCGYDFNIFDLLGAVFKNSRSIRDAVNSGLYRLVMWSSCHSGTSFTVDEKNPLRRFFCSELVACLYALVGVLPSNFDGRNYAPFHTLGVGTSTPPLTRQINYLIL